MPSTNFVQDYALKRQHQLDRAKHIREERLARLKQQQQQQNGAPSSPLSMNSAGGGGSNQNAMRQTDRTNSGGIGMASRGSEGNGGGDGIRRSQDPQRELSYEMHRHDSSASSSSQSLQPQVSQHPEGGGGGGAGHGVRQGKPSQAFPRPTPFNTMAGEEPFLTSSFGHGHGVDETRGTVPHPLPSSHSSSSSGGGGGGGGGGLPGNRRITPGEGGGSGTAGRPAPPKDAILQIAEADFINATKAGIITPDQSRQLWAALSQHVVSIPVPVSNLAGAPRVMVGTTPAAAAAIGDVEGGDSSSSRTTTHANPTMGPTYVTANALKALSNASSMGSFSSTLSSAGGLSFFQTQTITLESLRESIAQFKASQRWRAEGNGGGGGGRVGVNGKEGGDGHHAGWAGGGGGGGASSPTSSMQNLRKTTSPSDGSGEGHRHDHTTTDLSHGGGQRQSSYPITGGREESGGSRGGTTSMYTNFDEQPVGPRAAPGAFQEERGGEVDANTHDEDRLGPSSFAMGPSRRMGEAGGRGGGGGKAKDPVRGGGVAVARLATKPTWNSDVEIAYANAEDGPSFEGEEDDHSTISPSHPSTGKKKLLTKKTTKSNGATGVHPSREKHGGTTTGMGGDGVHNTSSSGGGTTTATKRGGGALSAAVKKSKPSTCGEKEWREEKTRGTGGGRGVSSLEASSSSTSPVPTTTTTFPPPPGTSIDTVKVGGGQPCIGLTEPIQEPMRACRCCGRTFRQSILSRHESVCHKVQKPRRAFDIKQQRLEGIDGIEEALAHAKYSSPTRTAPKAAGPTATMPKWKIQHEQFQAAMRAAHAYKLEQEQQQQGGGGGRGGGGLGRGGAMGRSGGGGGGASGGSSAMAAAAFPVPPDDRVPCPHCGRKFAPETAERHIPHCANTIARPKGLTNRPIRR